MEQEIIAPEPGLPKASNQAFSDFGCVLAAVGATLMSVSLLGSAAAAGVWAFSKLVGFPDMVLFVLLALAALPVLWATIWTAGRAWQVERQLARGGAFEPPVFKWAII